MTDQEKLTALLSEWGVPHQQVLNDHKEGLRHEIIVGYCGYPLEVEDSDKIDGYGGLYTAFVFTPDGHFVKMGAWE